MKVIKKVHYKREEYSKGQFKYYFEISAKDFREFKEKYVMYDKVIYTFIEKDTMNSQIVFKSDNFVGTDYLYFKFNG